jgi:hypothetical protein
MPVAAATSGTNLAAFSALSGCKVVTGIRTEADHLVLLAACTKLKVLLPVTMPVMPLPRAAAIRQIAASIGLERVAGNLVGQRHLFR